MNLALHYPHAARTPAELQVLACDWEEDLAPYSPAIVTQAAKKLRRESPFFPSTADMVAACEDMRKRIVPLAALPAETMTFSERCEYNREKARGLLDRIRGKGAGGPVRANFGATLENEVRQ